MPAKRSAMRKIKDVLRLKFEVRLSHEKIAAATGLSKGAVTNAVQRAVQFDESLRIAAGLLTRSSHRDVPTPRVLLVLTAAPRLDRYPTSPTRHRRATIG